MGTHEPDELLSAFLDGEATPEEAARVQAHLSGCPGCRRAAEAYAAGRRLLAAAPRRGMPVRLAAELQRRVDERSPRRAWAWPRPAWPAWAPGLAFAAAGLLACAWLWTAAAFKTPIPAEQLLAAHERYQDEGVFASVQAGQTAFASTVASFDSEVDD